MKRTDHKVEKTEKEKKIKTKKATLEKKRNEWRLQNRKQIKNIIRTLPIAVYLIRHYVEDMVIIKLIKLFTKKLKYILNHSFFFNRKLKYIYSK